MCDVEASSQSGARASASDVNLVTHVLEIENVGDQFAL
jgi:hypothetical protein